MVIDFVDKLTGYIQNSINKIHTAVPGTIVSYEGGRASVKPVLQYQKPDGSKIPYPVLENVPVVLSTGNSQNATIGFPIKTGDGCLLIFSERQLDEWEFGSDSNTDLKYDLSNAICIPGLYQKANDVVQEATDEDCIIISTKNKSKIKIKEDAIEVNASGNVNIQAPSVNIN